MVEGEGGGREGSRENIAQYKQSKNDRGVERWSWEEDAESSHPEPQIGSREQTLEVEGVFLCSMPVCLQ